MLVSFRMFCVATSFYQRPANNVHLSDIQFAKLIIRYRAYEQRVESGAQKQYYERTKNRKRAQYDAEKAALLADDYTLGADVLATQVAALPIAVNQ